MERIIRLEVNGWLCGTDMTCYYRVPKGMSEKDLWGCLREIAIDHLDSYGDSDEEDVEKEYDFSYEDSSVEAAKEEGYEVEEW